MKNVPNNFLQELAKNGRQIDAIITYQENGNTVTLDSDEIIAIKPIKKTQLLKSLMKECDIETSNPIAKDTQINVKIGLLINSEYKYISLGNFIIYSEPEYNADTLSYTMKAYDKMLYSMVDYKDMQVTYPISVRDFINKICQKIGLTFKNINDEFANYDKMISVDSYTGYDYKIRDVLDELAQVTASIICINNETDELEIRYPNETGLTLNEDYLKDVNVEIKEKFGPINTITLSRSADADNVYLDDPSSIIANGVCEIKIKDNQIMNFNDRSDYLPDILEKLKGLEYYIIDIESTGIMILDIYDLFNLSIWGEDYNCLLLNDELNIQDGISESIYNEIPEETETDYSKADKTDRRINQVYIIADKANKRIELVVSEIGDRTDKETTITQDVDSIGQTVTKIVDLTRTVSGAKQVVLEGSKKNILAGLEIEGNNQAFSKDTYIRVISQENLVEKLEKYTDVPLWISTRTVPYQNNGILYYTSMETSQSKYTYYLMKIDAKKTYRFKLNSEARINIGIFTKNPLLDTTQDTYGIYRNYFGNTYYQNSQWVTDKNQKEFYVKSPYTVENNNPEEQFLVLYLSPSTNITNLEVNEYIEKELIKTDYSPKTNGLFYHSSYVDKNTHEFIYADEYDTHYCYTLKIEHNLIYKVTKDIPINVFSLATFSNYPMQGDIATQYISNENEGVGLEELEVMSGPNDNYLTVTFFDKSQKVTNSYDALIISETLKIKKMVVESLGQYEGVADKYLLTEGTKSQIVRKIGYDEDGNKYIMPKEQIINYEYIEIPVFGQNDILQLVSDTAMIKATYIVENLLEGKFATVTELMAQIKILADQIALTVKQDDIIAQLNVAIREGKSIIEILGNILKIKTDNFELSEDGTTIIKKGTIASFRIGDMILETDLVGIAGGEEKAFWVKQTKNGEAVAYITLSGEIHARRFWSNGKNVIYSIATDENSLNNYGVIVQIQHKSDSQGNYLEFMRNDGFAYGCRAFVSDKKEKKNIRYSNVKALDEMMKIEHVSFEWKNGNGKVRLGYLANQLKKIKKDFVYRLGEGKNSRLQINELAIFPYITKSIQELYKMLTKNIRKIQKENQDLKKRIKKLEDMIGDK